MDDAIYILTNKAMPGYVVIGKANHGDVEQQAQELSLSASVPTPFTIYSTYQVKDADTDIRRLYTIFKGSRIHPEKSFLFNVEPDSIIAALNIPQEEDETQTKLKKKKKVRFSFDKVGIPVGAELSFLYDENIKATVDVMNKIRYNGKRTSLSRSAAKRLNCKTINGTDCWVYEGETLNQRRKRLGE